MKRSKKRIGSIRVAIPVETKEGLSSTVSDHFGMSPYFLICDMENGEVKELKTEANPGANEEVRMGLVAARFLIDQGVNAVLAVTMGDGPYWMLESNSVKMYKVTQAPSSKEEFEKCLENYEDLPEIINR